MEGRWPIPDSSRVPSTATRKPATLTAATLTAGNRQGRGILGVIDGFKSKGIEGEADIKKRQELLRKIGYKQ